MASNPNNSITLLRFPVHQSKALLKQLAEKTQDFDARLAEERAARAREVRVTTVILLRLKKYANFTSHPPKKVRSTETTESFSTTRCSIYGLSQEADAVIFITVLLYYGAAGSVVFSVTSQKHYFLDIENA